MKTKTSAARRGVGLCGRFLDESESRCGEVEIRKTPPLDRRCPTIYGSLYEVRSVWLFLEEKNTLRVARNLL